MTCPNCNTQHGCGCQAKTASDGTRCCSSCLHNVEKAILERNSIVNNPTPSPNNHTGDGIIAPEILDVKPIYNNLNN